VKSLSNLIQSDYRDPDISLAGLKIWIHSRQFPNSDDYWDGNWVNASASMSARGARIEVTAPFIHLGDLKRWHEQLLSLNKNLAGEANLQPMEPEISVTMVAESLGHITVTADLTPDHIYQKHRFEFEIDQSYLPPLIEEVEKVLIKFPLKGHLPL
jgi:hypothetical protein